MLLAPLATANGSDGTAAAEVKFTLVDEVCGPSDTPAVVNSAGPNECRLLCAKDPQCRTALVVLSGPWSRCELFTGVQSVIGTCTRSSCCFYKGTPPRVNPTASTETVAAVINEDRPWEQQMGVTAPGEDARAISLPMMLGVASASMILLCVVSFYVTHRRRVAADRALAQSSVVKQSKDDLRRQQVMMAVEGPHPPANHIKCTHTHTHTHLSF